MAFKINKIYLVGPKHKLGFEILDGCLRFFCTTFNILFAKWMGWRVNKLISLTKASFFFLLTKYTFINVYIDFLHVHTDFHAKMLAVL